MSFLFCPCGSKKLYMTCCEPMHSGKRLAEVPEQVMRARYSAFVKGKLDFLKKSLHPNKRSDYDEAATKRWADGATWKGLEIIQTTGGATSQGTASRGVASDQEGMVEFIASYQLNGKDHVHQERAQFRKFQDKWFYYEGHMMGAAAVKRERPKVGRNDPCPCGSGKKYKKCCAV